jgi:hypothetical protein
MCFSVSFAFGWMHQDVSWSFQSFLGSQHLQTETLDGQMLLMVLDEYMKPE